MPAIADRVIAELHHILGPRGLKTGEAVAALDRGFHRDNLAAGIVALPESTQQVSRLLALCNRVPIAVVPQGGRTGLAGAGASAPGQLILSTQRLNRVEEIDVADGVAVAQAGVTLEALNEAARPHGLCAGIDLTARGSCTIGGMIGTNAGGQEAFRYGVMRRRVLGLEAVLADGSVISELTRVMKVNTGYDIKQLLIGSEGTLGVVTRAVIDLVALRGATATAFCACPDAGAAVRLYRRLQGMEGARLGRAELMWASHVTLSVRELKLDWLKNFLRSAAYVIVEADAAAEEQAAGALQAVLGAAAEAGEIDDAILAKNEQERSGIWRIREEWTVDAIFPGGLWFDITVPLGRLGAYVSDLERRLAEHDPGLRLYNIGHLGDGNLHVTVAADKPITDRYEEVSKLIYASLPGMGGSISAEHGIGLEKKAALAAFGDPVKIEVMRRIRQALDPNGIMNPGKVFS